MKEGAKLTLDGRQFKILGDYPDDCFIGPSIFEEVTSNMVIAKDEIFGPVMSVIRVDNLDEAIKCQLSANLWLLFLSNYLS